MMIAGRFKGLSQRNGLITWNECYKLKNINNSCGLRPSAFSLRTEAFSLQPSAFSLQPFFINSYKNELYSKISFFNQKIK
jgi:hypothetical protein